MTLLFAAPSALLLLAAGPEPASSCAAPLDKVRVVECALSRSPEVVRARQELDALKGQRTTAGTWLPNLPTLSLTAAARRQGGPEAGPPASNPAFFNWSATFSQEVDLSGKPALRVAVVDAASQAQVRRVAATEQEVSAAALSAYFTLLATREALALSREVSEVAQSLGTLAEAQAKEELVSAVDAAVAKAEASRLVLVALEAERQEAQAQAQLTVLLGLPTSASPAMEGQLAIAEKPLEDVDALAESALTLRGDVAAAQAERQVAERRVDLLRRERVPNFTFSAFAQRDGFNENVIGGGLSLPIPLFAPVWPSRRGEIEEAKARAGQAETDVEALRRQVRLEVARAIAEDRSRMAAVRALDAQSVSQARQNLRALQEALTSRQLSIREALLAQRSLIEFLQADVGARLARALARVELLRAAGLPLSGDAL